jgi:methyl coenzyme M reductase subunit C-like uncharacterized protein (methanogenesis marker protein 7)
MGGWQTVIPVVLMAAGSLIAARGLAQWPCKWYFRNLNVRWGRMDMTADVEALMKRKEALEKQIEEARKKLQ